MRDNDITNDIFDFDDYDEPQNVNRQNRTVKVPDAIAGTHTSTAVPTLDNNGRNKEAHQNNGAAANITAVRRGNKNCTFKTRCRKRRAYWLLFTVCCGVIAVAAAAFILIPAVKPAPPVMTPPARLVESIAFATAPEPLNPTYVLPHLKDLYAQNPDLTGWLKIEGTVIDYPVMYTPDDGQFYLYRTFDKKDDPSKQGCLFVDEYNSPGLTDDNIIIHGHNMKNGSMFHTLIEYEDEDYYKNHPKINFDTLYEKGEYEIIAVFKSKVFYKNQNNVFKFYKFYDAKNAGEFEDFIKNIKELALYDTGVTAGYGDKLLTLTTCEYSQENGRLAVVAKKVNR